jgi:hypothetical protein
MQRRPILLLILFVVLAVFYTYGFKQSVPDIRAKQKAQLEQLNHLDEQASTVTEQE